MIEPGLGAHLARHANSAAPHAGEVAATIAALAAAGVTLASTIAEGALGGALAAQVGAANSDGDSQRGLDLLADERFLAAAAGVPVGLYASEELPDPVRIGGQGDGPARPLALAIDPLDGSSNIDTNVPIGTIFSIRPIVGDATADPQASFRTHGHDQIAAGFLIYGPQTALVLTLGQGTDIFVHSPAAGGFQRVASSIAIPPKTREFAINASNYRHWDEAVRLYFDDCIKGGHGPRESEFNMRWIASLVAEAYRILIRGGVFLYPGDRRRGYAQGGCGWFMKRTPWPCWSNRPAVPPPTALARSSISPPRRCTSAPRWCSDRPPKSRGSVAITRCPARWPIARHCLASAVCSGHNDHVCTPSDHFDHRFVGRRDHLGQAHFRNDLPPRTG